MSTLQTTAGQLVSTCIGGENVESIRVVRVLRPSKSKVKRAPRRTLAQMNQWLMKNATKTDAHARASTHRLIGRDAV